MGFFMHPQGLLDLYKTHFERACVNSPEYAASTFHMLIGAMPEIRKLKINTGGGLWQDPRVHLFYIAPSASGKGHGFTFAAQLASELGMKFQSVLSATDSGMVGSQEIDRSKDMDDPDHYHVEHGYLDPASGVDLVGVSEAGDLVTAKPDRFKRQLLDYFQTTMNPHGVEDNVISKKTGLGPPIMFNPECSLYFTTYKPAEFSEVVAGRGFFQRCVTIVNDVSEEQYKENRKLYLHYTTQLPIEGREHLIAQLKYLRSFASNMSRKRGLILTVDATRVLQHYLEDFDKFIEKLNDHLRSILRSYISRFTNHYMKLASHSALIRGSEKIEVEDMGYVFSNFHTHFMNTLSYIASNLVIPQQVLALATQRFQQWKALYSALASAIPNNPSRWVLTKDLTEIIVREGIMDRYAALTYYEKLTYHGLATTKTVKNRTAIQLKRDLRFGEVI